MLTTYDKELFQKYINKESVIKINYEFHITLDNVDKEKFFQVCKIHDIKPILLELQNRNNVVVLNDIMTSHHLLLNNDEEAFEELERIALILEHENFHIVRKKIEADINHPSIKSNQLIDNNQNYFECHLNVLTDDNKKKKLQEIAIKHKAHFSQNIFKRFNNKEYMMMLTYRAHQGTLKDFLSAIEEISTSLLKESFRTENKIIEYAIFDTKQDWDSKWLNSIDTSSSTI